MRARHDPAAIRRGTAAGVCLIAIALNISPTAAGAETAVSTGTGAQPIPTLAAQRLMMHAATGSIRFQSAEHPGFSRVVANWRDGVGYTVSHHGDSADITFDAAARVDLEGLGDGLDRIDGATVTVADDQTTLRLTIQPGDVLRDFRLGGHVVVDVIDPDLFRHIAPVADSRITRRGETNRNAAAATHAAAPPPSTPEPATPTSPPRRKATGGHTTSVTPGRPGTRGLDLKAWGGSSTVLFVGRRRALEKAAGDATKPRDQLRARSDLARFFLAHGFAAESLGALAPLAEERPDGGAADDPVVSLLRGAALLMSGRSGMAIEALSGPALDELPEARLWRTAAHVARGMAPDQPLRADAEWIALVEGYPQAVRAVVGPLAVEGAIAAHDQHLAEALLASLGSSADTSERHAWLGYLDGLLLAAKGDHEQGVERWRSVAETDTRRARAWALFRRADLGYGRGEIDPADAIATLETASFAWRADRLEFRIRARMADIYTDTGAFLDAFEALRQASDADPEHAKSAGLDKKMSGLLERLLIGDLTDTLSPFEAEVLYRRNTALADGLDKERLAERRTAWLARLDLVDTAAALLHARIKAAAAGTERARLGAELGEMRMRDINAEAALTALAETEAPEIDRALSERRRHLKARALAILGRSDEALTLLVGDDSDAALMIRAQVARGRNDWPAAVTAWARHLDGADDGEDTPHDAVLSLAAASVLAGDQPQLDALRGTYGSMMAVTPSAVAFDLLTDPAIPPIAETASVAAATESVLRFDPATPASVNNR